MSKGNRITTFIKEHKTMFIVISVVMLLLEIEIFAVAVSKSGRKSSLQILNTQGNVIFETDGDHLSHFDKYYFEKTFGPLDRYETRLVTRDHPFPFRAWFVAAVGIPVGVVLLLAFVIKAVVALFQGEEKSGGEPAAPVDESVYETRLEKIMARIARFNIFTIGFLIFAAIFLYWVVPNVVTYLGKVGIETLTRYKWVFAAVAGVLCALVAWIIYLRYLLARKSIESQTELKKLRLQIEAGLVEPSPLQIDYDQIPAEEKAEQPKAGSSADTPPEANGGPAAGDVRPDAHGTAQ